MFYQTLSKIEVEMLLDGLRNHGEISLCAHLLGHPVKGLRGIIARDEALKDAVEEAIEHHAALIYTTALRKASGPNGSDALLSTILSAKHAAFNKFAQQVDAGKKGKPTGITLRTFDATEDGVQDVVPTEPAQPLQIGYKAF